MVDPLAMTIATNVATRVADTLTDQAQQAISAIIRKMREKLHPQPGQVNPAGVLDAAIITGDASAIEELTKALEQLFVADSRFREEIQELWDSVHHAGSATNIFYGRAERVIMMRDVNGDLTIN
jgi:hypothetical protein